jgi:hypothetical protein
VKASVTHIGQARTALGASDSPSPLPSLREPKPEFPLTPAPLPKERGPGKAVFVEWFMLPVQGKKAADAPGERGRHVGRLSRLLNSLDSHTCWRRFSLSLGERAGVRGNGPSSNPALPKTPGTIRLLPGPGGTRQFPSRS